MDQNFGYTVYVKLFRNDQQLSFGLGVDSSASDLLDRVEELFAEAAKRGYTEKLAEMNPDENLQEITGWVLGEKSDGEPCIFGYHNNLQWKVVTVYLEDFYKLPIPPDAVKKAKQWPGQAPEREAAVNKGYMSTAGCPFTAILEPTGKQTQSGREIMRFSRTKGYTPKEPELGIDYDAVYGDLQGAAKKLADKMREEQKKDGAKKLQLANVSDVTAEIDAVTQRKGSHVFILQVLTGEKVADDGLAEASVDLLRKYLPHERVVGKKKEPNETHNAAYPSAMALIWGMIESKVEELAKADGKAPKAKAKREEDIPF